MSTQTGSPPPRRWLIAVPTAILVLLGILWSGFWFWSSAKAKATMAAWQVHEAEVGRVFGCADTTFGGYPFRIEIACAEPAVEDRRSALSIRARNLAAVAQVWDPTLALGEVVGPLTIAPLEGSPIATVDWTLAQASLRGVPGAPERLSMVLDNPSLTSVPASGALAKASHMEVHGRLSEKSTAGHPALDLSFELKSFSVPGLVPVFGTFGPLASTPADISAAAVVNGTGELASKPLGMWLREIRAAGGGVEITNARITQGDLLAVGSGTLSLTPRGTLAGELRWTVANFGKLVPMLGIDRAVSQVVSQDTLNRVAPALNRLLPGLGNIVRGGGNSGTGAAPAGGGTAPTGGNVEANAAAVSLAALAVGGQRTELEGQSAVIVTLRFDDGVAYLGPLKLGQIPPLY